MRTLDDSVTMLLTAEAIIAIVQVVLAVPNFVRIVWGWLKPRKQAAAADGVELSNL